MVRLADGMQRWGGNGVYSARGTNIHSRIPLCRPATIISCKPTLYVGLLFLTLAERAPRQGGNGYKIRLIPGYSVCVSFTLHRSSYPSARV